MFQTLLCKVDTSSYLIIQVDEPTQGDPEGLWNFLKNYSTGRDEFVQLCFIGRSLGGSWKVLHRTL